MAVGLCHYGNRFISCSSCNRCQRTCFPGKISLFGKRAYSKMSSKKYMEFNFTEDKSGFKVKLPGWSIDDVNLIPRDLTQSNYLRTFRIFRKLEQVREIAKGQGFLCILQFEKTAATYMKCLDLERCVSLEDLQLLPWKPYGYDLTLEANVSRIGKSSFQIDNFVRFSESNKTLFRGSLVYVTVDHGTKQPAPNPSKWVEKYRKSSSGELPPLRLSLQETRGNEIILHKSDFKIRYAEVDRFGHTNNTALNDLCADALLECYSLGKLPSILSVEQFEGAIKRLEVDFVGASAAGDIITAVVSMDSATKQKLLCKLYSKNHLIYVQGLEYDFDIATACGKL